MELEQPFLRGGSGQKAWLLPSMLATSSEVNGGSVLGHQAVGLPNTSVEMRRNKIVGVVPTIIEQSARRLYQ